MPTKAKLDLNTVVTQSEDQVSTEIDDRVVLMSVENGEYYKLDDIGSRIWALVEQPTRITALCDQLMQEFEVERSACEEDVLYLLDKLYEENLIRLATDA